MINQSLIHDPIIPVNLTIGENIIYLTDFFIDASKIKSVSFTSDIKYSYEKENSRIILFTTDKIPPIIEMICNIDDAQYSILLRKSRKISHEIVFNPNGNYYQNVQLAGSLNDWNPSNANMNYEDGLWKITLQLNPGKYHYQLIVDGNWILDPANPTKEDNNLGGFNSVMQAGELNSKQFEIRIADTTDNQIIIDADNDINEVFIFWQNYRLPDNLLIKQQNKTIITIPTEAKKLNRSFIRVWGYSNNKVCNDLLIPLEKGKAISSMNNINRFDKEASILYFMMIDRFNDGTPNKNNKVNDPEVNPKVNFFGGDIAGVKQKLDSGYFTKLGINTIWLSPITKNTKEAFAEFPEPHRKFTAYHGYWPVSLTKVDSRFGNEKLLKELVNDAHNKGINIILDFVSNHVHQDNQVIKEHPNWSTEIDLPDGTKNLRLWDSHRLTTWFDTFLPTWNFDIEEVKDYVSDSALYWVKEFDIDGFRHDATKHIPQKYWRTLTKKLKQQIILPKDKRLLQIGESFGSRELIGSYVSSGLLDAQFDFNLYFDARTVFALDFESFEKLNNSIKESLAYYGSHHLMGNITGNHDMARFISFAGEALHFDENSIEAGWNREIKVENSIGYKKLSSLLAFIMTIPGLPVIFYGDEYGMAGAGDPDNRRQMKFENLNDFEKQTKKITQILTKLRQNNMALNFGSYVDILVNDKSFVYYREYINQYVIVIFNKDNNSKEITFDLPKNVKAEKLSSVFKQSFSVKKNNLSITLPATSFEILI